MRQVPSSTAQLGVAAGHTIRIVAREHDRRDRIAAEADERLAQLMGRWWGGIDEFQ